MKIFRSIAGVIVGYAIFALSAVSLFRLAGRDPHTPQDALFALSAVLFGMAFAALGGFVGGVIAGRRPILHAGIVAVLIAVGAGVSLLSSPAEGAIWSQLAAILLMAPSALIGGIAKVRYSGKE
jgi:hypothetical protein